jgi:hypothetical protein
MTSESIRELVEMRAEAARLRDQLELARDLALVRAATRELEDLQVSDPARRLRESETTARVVQADNGSVRRCTQ